jgi:hypothetical protein
MRTDINTPGERQSQMNYNFLNVRIEDRVGWIEYNRPPINSFNWEKLREVPAALDDLLNDPQVRVVVFASANEKYFSTGADLKVFDGIGTEEMAEWVSICHGLVSKMRQSPKPLLAAIHGIAAGGGLEMVLHCDLRFASSDARLGQPEINIGFIPPVGTTQALARLIGRPRAIRYLASARHPLSVRRNACIGRRSLSDRAGRFDLSSRAFACRSSDLCRIAGAKTGQGPCRHPAHDYRRRCRVIRKRPEDGVRNCS